ncbi:MAG: hypothetical protein H7844_03995 [Nitrospirae bacterium YQR-1]
MDIRNSGLCTLYDALRETLSGRQDVYVVGGTVRDILIGRELRDIDIALPGENPYKEAKGFADKISGSFVKLNDKFKTARVVKGRYYFDFTSFRGETIEDDLLQRDFTINALAFPLNNGIESMVDVTGGYNDLKIGLIKMVSLKNFKDDPLRMLRAFRFMAELDFMIEEQTVQGIVSLKKLIGNVPAERVMFELKETAAQEKSSGAVDFMNQCSLLTEIFPEMKSKTVDLSKAAALYRQVETIINGGFYTKFMAELDSYFNSVSYRLPFLKLSALFYASQITADAASEICMRLKTSSDEAGFVYKILKNHSCAFDVFKSAMNTDVVVKFLLDTGDDFIASLVLTQAEVTLNAGDTCGFNLFCKNLLTFYKETFLPRLRDGHFITGYDLMETFGLKPSPLFSRIIRQVQVMALTGGVSNRAEALIAVEDILKKSCGDNPYV